MDIDWKSFFLIDCGTREEYAERYARCFEQNR